MSAISSAVGSTSKIAPVRTLTAEQRNTALEAVERRRIADEKVVMTVRISAEARQAAERKAQSGDLRAGSTDPRLLDLKSTRMIGDVKPVGPAALTISDPRVVARPSGAQKTINPALSAVNAAAVRLPTTIPDPADLKLAGSAETRFYRGDPSGAVRGSMVSTYV